MPGNFAENDLDTKGIENALARAARRAAKIAKETGTPLVLWKDGHIVEIYPEQVSHQDSHNNIPPGINS